MTYDSTTTAAAVYLRISRDDLATGLAVERQREDAMAILEARGWRLTDEYVDNAVSASKRNVRRPAYERMVADYAAGKFAALVCWDLDRLTRQPRQLEDWIEAAEERGLVLVTANGEADLGTDGGRMYARIKASVARAEVERKSARQRRANDQLAAAAKPVPGRRRFGYADGGLEPVPHEAAVVVRAFEHVASGGSLRSLALALVAEHVDPAPGRDWSTRRLRDMLTSSHYAGYPTHRGVVSPVKSSAIVPIVDEALAERVRAILADPARRTSPGPEPRHLSSGLATCGECGGLLMNLAGAYRCRVASHPTITKDRLDGVMRNHVARAFLTTPREAFPTGRADNVVALTRAHEALADRERSTLDLADVMSAAVLRQRLTAIAVERAAVEADLAKARTERSTSSALADMVDNLLDDLGRIVSMSEWQARHDAFLERFDALDVDRRRALIRATLAVTVYRGRSLDRVHVEHLVATHLNVDAVNPYDVADYRDANAAHASNRRAPRARASA